MASQSITQSCLTKVRPLGHETKPVRTIAIILAVLSIAFVLAVILLMPTLLASLLAATALAPTVYALINGSRKTAVVTDAILLTLVLAAHLQSTSILRSADPLDIVRVILILSFHEFSSIYSDLRRLEAAYHMPASGLEGVSSLTNAPRVYMLRSLRAGSVLIAATLISEGYYLLALQSSSSLHNIFGVAAGLTILIIFLFYLFQQTSNRLSRGT